MSEAQAAASSFGDTRASGARRLVEAGGKVLSMKLSGINRELVMAVPLKALTVSDTEAGEACAGFPLTVKDDNWRYRVRSIKSRPHRTRPQ